MSRLKQLGRNYQFLALSRVIGLIISFVLFPFIVSHAGKELYGIYLLLMTMSGYFGTFDLGVGSALQKYVPEYIGKNDTEGLYSIINASFSFFVILGLIGGIVLYFFGFWGVILFKINPSNEIIMRNLFWIFAIAAIFHWPLQTFKGVVQGLQRYDWLAGMEAFFQIFYLFGVYFLIQRGFGIISISILFQSLVIGTDFVFFLISLYYLKGLRLKFPYFPRGIFKKIFSFSIYVFLGGIAGMIILNVDDLVIGAFVSVAAISIYKVSYAMQNVIRGINGMIGTPLLTLCAEMEGANEYEKQRQLLLKGTRYTVLLLLPMISIAIIFSEPFILSWVGEGFREAILPAQTLLFFWIFNVIMQTGSGSLAAKGIVRPVLWISIATAIFNLVLSLILVKFLGIFGVALGTTLSTILIGSPLSLSLVLKHLKVNLAEFFNFSIKSSLFISLLSAILSMITIKFLQPSSLLWVLVEMAVIYSGVMLLNYLLILSSAERTEIKIMLSPEGWK